MRESGSCGFLTFEKTQSNDGTSDEEIENRGEGKAEYACMLAPRFRKRTRTENESCRWLGVRAFHASDRREKHVLTRQKACEGVGQLLLHDFPEREGRTRV